MSVAVRTTLLLVGSNVFMTFAWYAHLKNLNDRKWYIAALASWGIALFEYLLQVPANRIGYTQFSVAQLKITQEVITLSVFAPFAVLYLREPMKLDYLWPGLCLLGVVYFMFRSCFGRYCPGKIARCSMKKTVANLANGLRTLAGRSFAELASMIGHDEIKTVIGESGVSYQMERNVFCELEAWKKICVSWVRSTTAAGALFSRLPNL